MPRFDITEENITKQLKKIKDNKAPLPDGIKPELYKAMIDSKPCIRYLKRCYRSIVEKGKKSWSWGSSKTTMVQKKRRKKKTDGQRLKAYCPYKYLIQNPHGY